MALLIAGLMLTLFSIILSLVEKWKNSNVQGYRRQNILSVIGFLIGFLGLCMTFYSGRISISEKVKSDSLNEVKERENKQITEKLLKSQDTVIALQNELRDTTGEILNTSLRVVRAQKELIGLQMETNKQLTGDNAIPEVTYTNLGNNMVSFAICNNTNYSIPDVLVSMTDGFEIMKDHGTTNWDNIPNFLNYNKSYNIGTLYQKGCTSFYTQEIPSSWTELKFILYVYYRSGSGYLWHVRYARNEIKEFRITSSSYGYLHSNKKVVFPKLK